MNGWKSEKKATSAEGILFRAWSLVREGWDLVIDALYPPKCGLCKAELEEHDRGICRRCFESRELILDGFCEKCGKKLEQNQMLCYDCKQNSHAFVKGYSAFMYEEVKDAVLAMKYHRESWRAVALAELMAWLYAEVVEEWGIEAIVFVPQSRWDIGEKGYNPPELLATKLSAWWQIPLLKGYLKAHHKKHRQKGLGNQERKVNLKNIFYCKRNVPYRTILLIDDVYTTGATMDACSLSLMENGAEKIYFLTIASGGYRK